MPVLFNQESIVLNRIATGIAVTALMSSSALAADMSLPAPEPTPISTYKSATFDWSGFYAGVVGGYGFGDTAISDGVTTFTVDNNNGILAGVTVGGNMQYDQFVFGIEGDAFWNNQSGSITCPPVGTCSSDYDWSGSLRGRVGYTIDPVLIYATAGLAAARINTSISAGGSYSDTFSGWTIGGGVEAAVTEALSAKVEYAYSDYGSKTAPAGTLGPVDLTVSPTSHTIKAGLNFHF